VLSRKFKAMARIGGFFALAWGVIGTLVGTFGGGSIHLSLFLPSLLSFGVMFGALGGISGISTALLMARAESGRELGDLPLWRVTFWGFIGGFTPGGASALLALAIGAADVVGLLLVVSLISGGLGSAISGSAAAAAKQVGSGVAGEHPKLPAT